MNKKCGNCDEDCKKKSRYCLQNKTTVCIGCEKEFEYICNMTNGVRKYCSIKCFRENKQKLNKCVLCGDSCIEKYCSKSIQKECKGCKKEFTTKCFLKSPIFCSKKCAINSDFVKNKIRETQFRNNSGKYAFNTPKQKETMIEKYGFSSPAKNTDVKRKSKETQERNHNGVMAFNTPEQRKTMIKRYGGTGSLSSEGVRIKQEKTMLERYGVRRPAQNSEFLQKSLETIISNNGYLFNNGSKISKINKSTAELIQKEFSFNIEFEKVFETLVVDLYIPEINLAIDINPSVTHNSTIAFQCLRSRCSYNCSKHQTISIDYHHKRLLKMIEKDVNYISYWDWESDYYLLSEIQKIFEKSFPKKKTFKSKTVLSSKTFENLAIKQIHEPKVFISGLRDKKVYKDSENLSNEELLSRNLCRVFDQGSITYEVKNV